ncbi:MAG: hypothetical protein GX684_00880 [Ruminococcaceae bacterium]|nr:hypothetical protein [Oscillospiraceae bacterium]
MKRAIAFALLLTILFTLAACGKSQTAVNIEPGDNAVSGSPEAVSSEAHAETSSASPIPIVTEPPAPTPPTFVIGSVSPENIYSNAFSGLKFKLPEGWKYASNEELSAKMGEGSSVIFSGSETEKSEYVKSHSVYDLIAGTESGTPSMAIIFENISAAKVSADITEEIYLQSIMSLLAKNETFKYKHLGSELVKIAGKDFYVMYTLIEDYNIYQAYYVKLFGDYMMSITITDSKENPGSDIIGNFENIG